MQLAKEQVYCERLVKPGSGQKKLRRDRQVSARSGSTPQHGYRPVKTGSGSSS